MLVKSLSTAPFCQVDCHELLDLVAPASVEVASVYSEHGRTKY